MFRFRLLTIPLVEQQFLCKDIDMKIVEIKVTKQEWQLTQAIVKQKIAEGMKPPFMVYQHDDKLPTGQKLDHDYYVIEIKNNPLKKYLIGAISSAYSAIYEVGVIEQALNESANRLGRGGFGEVRKVLWEDGSVSAVKKLDVPSDHLQLTPAIYNYQITKAAPDVADDKTISFYYNEADHKWDVYKGAQKISMQFGLGETLSLTLSDILDDQLQLTHLEDNFVFVSALRKYKQILNAILPEDSTFETVEVNALRKLGYLKANVRIFEGEEAEEEQNLIFQTLFEGQTLADFFKSGFEKDVPRSEIIKMGYLAANVIAELHKQNVIQLDFNLGNFIINYFETCVGTISAIDFGQAHIIELDQTKLQYEKEKNIKQFIKFLISECFVAVCGPDVKMPTDEGEICDRLKEGNYPNINDLIGDLRKLQELARSRETDETKETLRKHQNVINFLKEKLDHKIQSEKVLLTQDSEYNDYSPLKTKPEDYNKTTKPAGYDKTVNQELEFNKTTYIKPKPLF